MPTVLEGKEEEEIYLAKLSCSKIVLQFFPAFFFISLSLFFLLLLLLSSSSLFFFLLNFFLFLLISVVLCFFLFYFLSFFFSYLSLLCLLPLSSSCFFYFPPLPLLLSPLTLFLSTFAASQESSKNRLSFFLALTCFWKPLRMQLKRLSSVFTEATSFYAFFSKSCMRQAVTLST